MSDRDFTPPILSKLIIAPYPISPSPSNLIKNQDGQICILSRNELNIFTPSFGMQADSSSIYRTTKNSITEAQSSLKGKEKARESMPVFKTAITINKNDKTNWSHWSNDERTFTGASANMDLGWRSATWSPSSVSSLGGCVLAALTNNNEVMLYEPRRDAHKSEWFEVYDLTEHLTRSILPDHNDPKPSLDESEKRLEAMKVLECQATCIAWSQEVDNEFGDFSLLVVGHRSGHISLWRRSPNGEMELVKRFRINERAQWIVGLCWSPWTISKLGTKTLAVSQLAVADSQGGIWTTAITQDITVSRNALVVEKEAAMDVVGEDETNGVITEEPLSVGEKDGRAVSQFCWATKDSLSKLVYTKLGTVNFVTFVVKKKIYSVKSDIELELKTEGASKWVGATSLAVCCGIEYLPSTNAIVLALTSSSFHTFTLDPIPAHAKSCTSLPSSTELTSSTRQIFAQIVSTTGMKPGETPILPTKQVGGYLFGFNKFTEDGSEMGYFYTSDAPSSLAAPIGIRQLTVFVLSSYLKHEHGDEHLSRLETILSNPPNSRSGSPLAILRSSLHFINDNSTNREFIENVLNLLPLELVDDAMITDEDDSTNGDSNLEKVTINVLSGLCGDEILEGLRLREIVARFIVNLASLSKDQKDVAVLVQSQLCRQVNKAVAVRLNRILSRANTSLQAFELDISGRIMIASASLPSEPLIPNEDGSIPSPYNLSAAFGAPEKCPACEGAIPLENIRSARCENGHEWERCSITLTVIATVKVRTCTGCERKALNTFGKNEEEEKTSVVATVLKASSCCLFCGGRWMRLR